MASYFSMRVNSLLNSSPFSSWSSVRTNPNIRWQRSPNTMISFLALRMESSGVCISPAEMKLSRASSSSASFFGLMTLHTIFSICGTNQIMMSVFAMLKEEWNVGSTSNALVSVPAMA